MTRKYILSFHVNDLKNDLYEIFLESMTAEVKKEMDEEQLKSKNSLVSIN